MDPTQLLLLVLLTVTTVMLLVVGVQLFIVLRELHKTLARAQKIISGFEQMGSGMSSGFSEVMGFVHGIKTILKVADHVTRKKTES